MRLSELGGKEIINLYNGARLGVIGNSDLVFDKVSGKIIYLLIPKKRAYFFLLGDRNYTEVSWDAIRKVGPDIVIIDMEDRSHKKYDDLRKSKNYA
ncbi:MAG TPA: YlmC/YmxH family sporulation protein [Thermoanaerobacterales bacterium]|jgi:YlmC/YmxH family sporulation protein|nr:YlmC/YmxH family sporulation protein [Thermoanaerobacterales bacterium]